MLLRARITRSKLHKLHDLPDAALTALDDYVAHGERQRDQVHRRVLLGERIPHAEKVFSIFEPHTEWINKGKAGVMVELGLRVAVSEDQYGFILNHRVMQKQTDDQIAVPLVEDIAKHYPAVKSVSMDKGFHSPENQRRLAEVIEFPVLPKKGTSLEPIEVADPAQTAGLVLNPGRATHEALRWAIEAVDGRGWKHAGQEAGLM